jgi:adenylosuccinate synthase
VLKNVKPVYKELPGWSESTSGIRDYKDLPRRAQGYLSFLRDDLKARISIVSIGSSRQDTLFIK